MKLIYKPSYTDGYSKVAGQDVAMLICLPDAYSQTKKWPVKIFCHGMGQRGPGTTAALQTVFDGPYQAIPNDWKTEIDAKGIIGVIVNYNDFFQPASWRFVDQYLRANYSVVDKFMRQGFSWGGGSLNRAMQQADIAAATAVAVLAAPTVESGDTKWTLPAKSGAVVWVHVNSGDDVVGAGPARSIVAGINSAAPVVAATLTEYNQPGHGATNEAVGAAPPPGYAESATDLYLRVLAGNISVPKTGTSIPIPPVQPPPSSSVVSKPEYKLSGNIASLVGSKSTGYSQGYEGTWEFVSGPAGISAKQVFPSGSSYIDAKATLPVAGTYVFRFILKGADAQLITVVYGNAPAEKVPASFDGINLVFSDGSKESATIKWDGIKWTATTATKTYTL